MATGKSWKFRITKMTEPDIRIQGYDAEITLIISMLLIQSFLLALKELPDATCVFYEVWTYNFFPTVQL